MDTFLQCSFYPFSKKGCGISTRYQNLTSVLPLNQCTKSTLRHLKGCYATSSEKVNSEAKLCLARVGLFEETGETLTICPLHRDEFGLGWRPSKVCQYPQHDCKQKPVRGISMHMSKEIYNKLNVLCETGQGICMKCLTSYNKMIAVDISEENIAEQTSVDALDTSSKDDEEEVLRRSTRLKLQNPSKQEKLFDASGLDEQFSLLRLDDLSFEAEAEVKDNEPMDYIPTPLRLQHGRLQELNRLMSNLTSGRISPVRFQLHQPLSDCAKSTRYYMKRKAKEVIGATLDSMAPGQSDELLNIVTSTTADEDNRPEAKVMADLVSLYQGAKSWYTKMTILSIFVKYYTKRQLRTMVPGLTIWRIDQARKHAAMVGAGVNTEKEPVVRYRLDETKVNHFLDFISCPNYIQDVAYGSRKLRMSTGEIIEIPNLVRTVVASRMVMLYQAYCREQDFIPLGRSTLFTILQVCAASHKKCLSGLDSVASEGSSAFDTIEDALNTMGSFGVPLSWNDNMLQRIRASHNYLKADYKLHISEGSPCADHCLTHALSSKDTEFSATCDHEHFIECDRCKDLKTALEDIGAKLDGTDFTQSSYPGRKEELQYDVQHAIERIIEWKAHILRAINQERAKTDFLWSLKKCQALIVMDWAMKWLPRKFREAQCEWFGKKGISWHVSACITRDETMKETDFEVQTFVHIFDACTQDWFAVASIIESLASEISKIAPNVRELYLRSDNAGCYHNAALLSSVPVLISSKGLKLKNYSFSEANSGKDVCDRKIAPLKAHIERYLNEGHDVTTAAQLKEAIDSYGGVKGCWAAVGELDTTKQIASPLKWTGISQFNNFRYEDDGGITVWQAYEVGKGKKLSKKYIEDMGTKQQETGVKIITPFLPPRDIKGALKKTAPATATSRAFSKRTDNPEEDPQEVFFTCPEEGCIKAYRTSRNLQRHLDFGRHQLKLHQEMQYDSIRRQWAERCTSVKAKNPTCHSNTGTSTDTPESSSRGWALHKSKKSNRFSSAVKNYLLEQFMIGEDTGCKVTPAEASRRMRSLCKTSKTGEAGTSSERVFQKEEWLTTQQIASYFSRLSTLKKSGKLPKPVEVNVDEKDLEPVIAAIQRYNLRSRIYNQLTL